MPTLEPARIVVPRWRTRMLPASTASPPNFFTPRRLLCDSRPLRVLPPAFLCAMDVWLRNIFVRPQRSDADAGDLDLRVLLAMRALAQVVLAATEFHDDLLLALAVLLDDGFDLAALEQRRADLDVVPVAEQQDFA